MILFPSPWHEGDQQFCLVRSKHLLTEVAAQALAARIEQQVAGLTALDMFKLLTCLHMHRAPSPSLYMACAAALAPKLDELQYACAARVGVVRG